MKSLIVGDKPTVRRLAERLERAQTHSEYQRIQCVLIRATLGSSAAEIAHPLGWSVATVHVMHSRWAKEGEALFGVHARGGRHHQYLTAQQEQEALQQARAGRSAEPLRRGRAGQCWIGLPTRARHSRCRAKYGASRLRRQAEASAKTRPAAWRTLARTASSALPFASAASRSTASSLIGQRAMHRPDSACAAEAANWKRTPVPAANLENASTYAASRWRR